MMQFPHCDHEKHNVIDTKEKGETIRRRRHCQDCTRCFITYEHVAPGIGRILSGGAWLVCSNEKATRTIQVACFMCQATGQMFEII